MSAPIKDFCHRAIRKLRDLPGGKTGIYIKNRQLGQSFEAGDSVITSFDYTNQSLTVEKAELLGNFTISCLAKDESKTPIFDMKNSSLNKLFKGVEQVEILMYPNKMIIKVAGCEIAKNERTSKDNMKTFEFFCGGGTLSQQFKQAGYTPVGGLELDDRYLKMFQHNHKDAKYTILGSIKDVMPSDYPQGIELGLIGLPCTAHTGSNVQMINAQARLDKNEATKDDVKLLDSKKQIEYLVFYVLEGIRTMNLKTVVLEEVEEFKNTFGADFLKGILTHLGYEISETVSEGLHNKRARYCMVANMGNKVNLNNLIPEDNKTIADFLDISVEDRNWKPKEEITRIDSASKKSSIGGIRFALPSDKKTNTFTTLATRHTEQCLKHPTKDLYSEFTNSEIAAMHGIHKDYELSAKKTVIREVLGQGVSDMFYFVAQRIKEANNYMTSNLNALTQKEILQVA